jgi:hypothetical protein
MTEFYGSEEDMEAEDTTEATNVDYVFWANDTGGGRGGYFYRAVGLGDFLQTIVDSGETPVGIRIEVGSNNIEVIVEDNIINNLKPMFEEE